MKFVSVTCWTRLEKRSLLLKTVNERDLDTDEMLALAIVRLVEILGEAAKNVSQDLRDQLPDIAWRQMAGTRDRLTHAYFDVNLDIIWDIIINDLPPLVEKLEEIFNDA